MQNMLVKRLESEVFDLDSRYRVETVLNPDWHAIETGIRTLHRYRRPAIRLYLTEDKDDDDYMTIMGGNGLFWVAVTTGPYDQRRLFNPDRGSDEVPLWTSDQGFSDYEFHTTGQIDDVLAAARYFCEHADCDPRLNWE
jgi:hypothetical protein